MFTIFQDSGSFIKSSSYFECRSACQNDSGCKWFSYSSFNSDTCLLFTDCPEIEEIDLSWVSSEKDCNNSQCFLGGIQCRVSM